MFFFHQNLGAILRKTQVPLRIDETLDESLYRGGNPHLTSRFCKNELGPKFQHATRLHKVKAALCQLNVIKSYRALAQT